MPRTTAAVELTPEQIARAVGAPTGTVGTYWPAVKKELAKRGLRSPAVQIAAIATIGVEVGSTFQPIHEFGDRAYFTRMYDGRADLGNVRRGDGARYHGRGFIQLTGRANYRNYGKKLGFPLEDDPDLALKPEVAAAVFADYFKERRIAESAEKGDWETVRRKVNGGLNGWARFETLVKRLSALTGAAARPAAPPKPRTLMLTSPLMSGQDVVEAQRALGLPDDGDYGPVTASAVAAWKQFNGYPDTAVNSALTPKDVAYLTLRAKLPPAYERRARERSAETAHGLTVPEKAVAEMERWAKLGWAEKPPGSNRVPQLVRLAKARGVLPQYQGMGFAWCAFSAFLAALGAGGKTADLMLRKGLFNGLYCPAILAEANAGRFGLRTIAPSQAKRGDVVLFDWGPGGDPVDHVGRLVAPPAGGKVKTVDGNSGQDDLQVVLRERPVGLVRAYVRDS
jgi:hypothetical protein